MRSTVIVGGILVVAAVAFMAYRMRPTETPSAAVQSPLPPPSAPVASVQPAVPAAQTAATVPAREDARPEVVAQIEDGDQHETAQRPTQPLESPPPSREVFGADPASETAALQEARAMLDALERQSDPETKAQIAKLRESIDAER